MFLCNKTLSVRVAKHVKVPLHNIHQKDILFSYPEQHFFRQQVAYVFYVNQNQSSETTESALLLQKKGNMLLYLKFHSSALRALLMLGSWPHNISSLNNQPDVSVADSLTFLGADNELYTAYYLNNNLKIARISDGANVYELIALKTIGIGLPLYNNYIPLVVLANDTFIIILYDIVNKTRYEIANYDIEFLEKQLNDYINKLTGRNINNNIRYYRSSYKILEPYRFTDATAGKSFEICSNLSVCESVLYIGNRAINEYGANHIVFEIQFKIRDQNLHYEFSIPRRLSFKSFGLEETPTKHVIETKTLSIRLPNGNHITPNISYYQNDHVIVRDFVYNESYYILDLRKNTKNKISNEFLYCMRFYIANNIIMIVYYVATWYLMIYDTINRRFFNILLSDWYEETSANLVSYYYIEKCKKAVFILGGVNDKHKDFYNIENNRTVHVVSAITILDLSKISNITDNDDIEKCKEIIKFPFWMGEYLKAKERSDIFVNYVKADCTVDVNKSMLYITAFVSNYKNPVITIAKNLCKINTEFYDFAIDVPISRTREVLKDRIKPIYISSKALKSANLPKYLHRYDLKGFYDFINSKTISMDLVFINYPNFRIIDRYYNRVSLSHKEFSDFYRTTSALIDSYIVGYYILQRDQMRSLAGFFVINDLTVVRLS